MKQTKPQRSKVILRQQSYFFCFVNKNKYKKNNNIKQIPKIYSDIIYPQSSTTDFQYSQIIISF